jgi:hypothetical protein
MFSVVAVEKVNTLQKAKAAFLLYLLVFKFRPFGACLKKGKAISLV